MTLTVENGCFSYDGRHTVLSDISFCASPGEIVAILGKNGSGKTTLLKCSVGLLKWSGGHSFLDGRDVLHIKSRELWSKISYVPQAKSSFGGYTVLDSVLLGFGSSIGIFG
ncbi:MAG: ABC transporter ATP-binding protein, partial [Clostridia bacterium]|nr:ABC transporter ATP-binding protein [Clostridia bacterium]